MVVIYYLSDVDDLFLLCLSYSRYLFVIKLYVRLFSTTTCVARCFVLLVTLGSTPDDDNMVGCAGNASVVHLLKHIIPLLTARQVNKNKQHQVLCLLFSIFIIDPSFHTRYIVIM